MKRLLVERKNRPRCPAIELAPRRGYCSADTTAVELGKRYLNHWLLAGTYIWIGSTSLAGKLPSDISVSGKGCLIWMKGTIDLKFWLFATWLVIDFKLVVIGRRDAAASGSSLRVEDFQQQVKASTLN